MLAMSAGVLGEGRHGATVRVRSNDPHSGAIDVPVVALGRWVDGAARFEPDLALLDTAADPIALIVELEPPWGPDDLLLDTLRLDGRAPPAIESATVRDTNRDGRAELHLHLARAPWAGAPSDEDTFVVGVTGELRGGAWLRAAAGVRTVRPRLTAPHGGETLRLGQRVALSWVAPRWSGLALHDVELSLDDGTSWTALARGLAGTRFDWIVRGPASGQRGLLRVVARTRQGFGLGSDTIDQPLSFTTALPFSDPAASSSSAAATPPR
jgi:hypothetical protein